MFPSVNPNIEMASNDLNASNGVQKIRTTTVKQSAGVINIVEIVDRSEQLVEMIAISHGMQDIRRACAVCIPRSRISRASRR